MLQLMREVQKLRAEVATANSVRVAPKSHDDDERTAYNGAGPSVVRIEAYDKPIKRGWSGAGFAVDRHGLIATALHVVRGAGYVYVKASDESWTAAVRGIVASDEEMDVAILATDADEVVPLAIGNAARLQPGDKVMALGYPEGLPLTISTGLLSARSTDPRQLQLSTPVTFGSSGGPLLGSDLAVLGVVTSGLPGKGVNFGTASSVLLDLLSHQHAPDRNYPPVLRRRQ